MEPLRVSNESLVVLYDAETGNIVHTHRVVSFKDGEHPDKAMLEKQALEQERDALQQRLAHRLPEGAPAGASGADAARMESLAAEVKALQQEREQIRRRISSLLEVLEQLESL